MTSETLIAMCVFALVTSMTPGPNNLMLMASGVNFGFRRTLPHMVGIALGFSSLLIGVGTGLGALFSAYPQLHVVLKIAGGAYLIYLAYRVAMSRSMGQAEAAARPMTLLEAAAFQWVNPKAWIIGLSAMSLYTAPGQPFASVLFVAAAFTLLGVPSLTTWTGFGTMLRSFLADPMRLKWFNITMGILLALSLWPMLF